MANPTPPAQSWTAAEQAVNSICGGQGNYNHLWQLVRSLCELGLAGLLQPVLATITLETPAWITQRDAVLEQAARLPSGLLDWETRRQMFADNIAALSAANPALSGLADFWQQNRSRYDLYQATDGNYQVVDRQAPTIFAGFVGGLIDHRALTRHWTYQCRGYQLPRPIAFDGAGYGWVLLRVLETTHRTLHDYSCAVYVIEPDLVSACILLNLHDLRPFKHRIRAFAGPDALSQFSRSVESNLDWDIPNNLVSERINQRPALNMDTATKNLADSRNQIDARSLIELNQHYSQTAIPDWAERFESASAGKTKLKVIGLTSRYTTVLQYSMDELGKAVRAAGHEFILCKEPDDQSATVPELRTMNQHKPDLVLMISRLRSENPRMPKNVPCLTWDQDNLPCMRTPAARDGLDAMTYIAGLGARLGYEQLEWPRENCILAFGAAATHRYHNGPVDPRLLDKHRCNFSYTSNASALPESLVSEYRGSYTKNARLGGIFDQLAAEVLSQARNEYVWDTLRVEKLVDDCCTAMDASLAEAERRTMVIQLRLISDRAFRHVALEWVADYCRANNKTLRLYGSGWESNPKFAQFAAGFLAPGEEMRAVYQASDINLQIIETGFMHSRVLDGLAAGGFFLYRLSREARDLDNSEQARLIMARRAIETNCVTFGQLDASTDPLIVGPWDYMRGRIKHGQPHERCRWLDIWLAAPSEETCFPQLDKVTFATRQQFCEMADHYLDNPDARRQVAGSMRQIVLDQFSYDTRWQQFLDGIASGLRQAAASRSENTALSSAA